MALMQRYLRSQFINSTIGRPVLIGGILNSSAGVAASRTLGGVTYTAVTPGTAGNSITIEYLDYIPAVAAVRVVQDLTYTAVTAGAAGNSITIEYTTGGTAGAEVVSVVGTAISVQIDSGVSTATQVRAAVLAFPAAIALVIPTISGTAGAAQVAAAPIALAGGTNSQGAAGSEVVIAVGSAISVRLQSGVSTITQVRTAVNASILASPLVTASGTSGTAVTAPVAATALTGGAAGSTSFSGGNLISSFAKTGTGQYTLTLADTYNSAQYLGLTLASSAGVNLVPQIMSQNVSTTGAIVFNLLAGATPTDPVVDVAISFMGILNVSSLH